MGKDVVAVATFYPTRDAAKIVWDGIKFIFSELGFVEGCKILFRTLRTASIYKPFLKNSAYIANVACNPSHQGKGLASLLMKSIEGLRGPLRVERYELDVELDNTPARKLYEKLGWKVRNMTIPTSLLPGVVRMVKEF
jgi:ribosomal protein S18 acetylase RimI-like enzyme